MGTARAGRSGEAARRIYSCSPSLDIREETALPASATPAIGSPCTCLPGRPTCPGCSAIRPRTPRCRRPATRQMARGRCPAAGDGRCTRRRRRGRLAALRVARSRRRPVSGTGRRRPLRAPAGRLTPRPPGGRQPGAGLRVDAQPPRRAGSRAAQPRRRLAHRRGFRQRRPRDALLHRVDQRLDPACGPRRGRLSRAARRGSPGEKRNRFERPSRPARRTRQRGPRQSRRTPVHPAVTQFSVSRPGTRSNSRRLFDTSVRPSLRAWAAMCRSLTPMGRPAASSAARTAP